MPLKTDTSNRGQRKSQGRKPRESEWKKGESGNIQGRRFGVNGEIQLIKKETKEFFIEKACQYLTGPVNMIDSDEIKKREKKKGKISGAEMDIIAVRRRMVAGDLDAINWFYNRLFGRPTESIDHKSSDGTMTPTLPEVKVYVPKNGREADQ